MALGVNFSMSALGHEQTFCNARAMSALHPKADMFSVEIDVRYLPKADIGSPAATSLSKTLMLRSYSLAHIKTCLKSS